MEPKDHEADNSHNLVNQNDKFINLDTTNNPSYLYPNGHRMTNQMKWFKGSRDRGISEDIAA